MAVITSICVHQIDRAQVTKHQGERSAPFVTIDIGPVSLFFDTATDAANYLATATDQVSALLIADATDRTSEL